MYISYKLSFRVIASTRISFCCPKFIIGTCNILRIKRSHNSGLWAPKQITPDPSKGRMGVILKRKLINFPYRSELHLVTFLL